MKAWEIRLGRLDLHDVESPNERAEEMLIHVSHVGLCGSDLPKLLRPNDFALPEFWRPGHEIVGTDPVGRTVAVDPLVPCATCSRCVVGDTHLCPQLRRLGWELPGGFAEQVAVPSANVHALPASVDPLVCALADPAAVAIHGLRCNPIGEPGRMAVIGPGTVGLLTALYAHTQGWKVTVVHRDDHLPDAAVARSLPVEFRSSSNLAKNDTFDVAVDAATGVDSGPLEQALRLVREGGTVVVQNAYHPGIQLAMPLRDVFRRSIRLVGSFSYCRRHRVCDISAALRLLEDNHERVLPLVSVSGDLTNLAAIIDGSSRRSVRRVLTVKAGQNRSISPRRPWRSCGL
jgi:threonine dehydrogenase-like Zn-dependent dehydrogenase